jgi:hypothetical protein
MIRKEKHGIDSRVVIGAAVASLVAGSAAWAADGDSPEVKALTQPSSSIEVGAGNVNSSSFKFGEYNGLQKDGGFVLGAFDFQGGGSYDSSDTTRWRIQGADLGLSTRSINGEIGKQGKFRFTFGYDELRHNAPTGDSYQTPYIGGNGSPYLLPSSWIVPIVPRLSGTSPNARGLSPAVTSASGIVAGVSTAPTAAQLTTAGALQAADLPAFHGYQLYTERKRLDAAVSAVVTPKWEFSAGVRSEDRTGAKAMGTVSRQSGGDIATILPDPIDQNTTQFNATLGYKNKRSFVQVSYFASVFDNKIKSLSWQNWALPGSTAAMSSAPGNKSSQFLLSAGHDLGTFTRIAASGSMTRNTQNDAFMVDAATPLVPVSSLNGKVETTNYAVKLTSRPVRALNLGLGYKSDDRKNKTAVNTYGFFDAQEAAGGTAINANFGTALSVSPAVLALLKSNTNINANRPYSRKLGQLDADVDWTFMPGHSLHLNYESSKIDRYCTGSWISCVDAASTKENTFTVSLRSEFTATLHGRVEYLQGNRKVDAYNENAFLALVPMANVSPTGATGGATAYSFMLASGWNGWGPALGLPVPATTGNAALFFPLNNALANAMYQNQNRISELPGMRRYNMAGRDRDRARGELDWQIGEKFSLQGSGDYRTDRYKDSTYGLTVERDWSANFEAVYTGSEKFSVTAFFTREKQQQQAAGNTYTANSAAANVNTFTAISGGCFATIALRNASNKLDPCLNWASDMSSTTNVFGFSIDRKGMLPSGKLSVKLDGDWSRANTLNHMAGGNYANNPLAVAGAAVGTIAAYYVPATDLPRVTTDVMEFHLQFGYALSARSTLRLGALYADYASSDWSYAGLGFGGASGVLPTAQVSPHYGVTVVTLGYSARF